MPLEHRLQEQFPHWFRGRRASFARPLLRTIGRWSRFDQVEAFLRAHAGLRDFDFVAAALDHLQVRYLVDPAELARIPATGRLLIVANHPSGATDALALLDAVGRVRRDVKIVANDLLSALEPLSGLLAPVRILGGRPTAQSLAAIDEALRAEQCVIVFPAGEVARLGLRGVTDGRWRRGFLRFARGNGAPVLPVRIEARNSALFYGASALFKPAGTALLAREMFARRAHRVALRVGRPLSLPADGDPNRLLREVRRELFSLGRRRGGPDAISAAMELMGHWNPGVMGGILQEESGDENATPPEFLGWFNFPAIDGAQGDPTAALGGGDGFSCSAWSPPECTDLLNYITSVEVQTRFGEIGAGIPVTPGSEAGIADVNLQQVLAGLQSSSYVQLWLDTAYGPTVGGAMNEGIVSLFGGQGSPDSIVDNMRNAAATL